MLKATESRLKLTLCIMYAQNKEIENTLILTIIVENKAESAIRIMLTVNFPYFSLFTK